MTDIKVAGYTSLFFTEINDHIFLISRHGCSVETPFVHALEILDTEFTQRTAADDGKTFFPLRPSAFYEKAPVFKNRKQLIVGMDIKRIRQVFRRSPFSLGISL